MKDRSDIVPFYTRETRREAETGELTERKTIRVNSDPNADVLAVMTFKNLPLYTALKEIGKTQGEIGEICGVGQTTISGYLTLRLSPFKRRTGEYSSHALRLAEGLGKSPEELFPISLYASRLPRSLEAELTSKQVALASMQCSLLHDALDQNLDKEKLAAQFGSVLGTLTPREGAIIKMRFGLEGQREHTLDEVGEMFHIGRARTREIEQKALRKLRHPARSRRLRPFLEEASW